jgi:hypothetical protein
MKTVMRIIVSCAIVAAFTTMANAQAPYGGVPGLSPNGPTYSPYLNLLRSGNSVGFNYFGLVRPELRFRGALQGMEQQIGVNEAQISQLGSDPRAGLPVTGHTAVFLNTGGYFLNVNGGGATKSVGISQGRPGGGMPGTNR